MGNYDKSQGCVSLIGMAGSGKTTVARQLSQDMDWTYLDSDHLIEAAYARPLQQVTDAMSREEFLVVESETVCAINASRAVIATGGSVPYSAKAMVHLRGLGPVIWLDVPLHLIESRIALNPDRGLVIAHGQTIGDLLNERVPLYRAEATHICHCGEKTPQQISAWIRENIFQQGTAALR